MLHLTNKRLDDINARLIDHSRRIDETNKRIDDTNKRIDDSLTPQQAARNMLAIHLKGAGFLFDATA